MREQRPFFQPLHNSLFPQVPYFKRPLHLVNRVPPPRPVHVRHHQRPPFHPPLLTRQPFNPPIPKQRTLVQKVALRHRKPNVVNQPNLPRRNRVRGQPTVPLNKKQTLLPRMRQKIPRPLLNQLPPHQRPQPDSPKNGQLKHPRPFNKLLLHPTRRGNNQTMGRTIRPLAHNPPLYHVPLKLRNRPPPKPHLKYAVPNRNPTPSDFYPNT